MKLIIDISKEAYNGIKMGMRNRDDMREVGEAIENGIPLDNLREEIDQKKYRRMQSDIQAGFNSGIECALRAIDRYREGEQDDI